MSSVECGLITALGEAKAKARLLDVSGERFAARHWWAIVAGIASDLRGAMRESVDGHETVEEFSQRVADANAYTYGGRE